MATSVSNFTTVAEAQAAIEAHQLCQSFLTTPTQFAVFYPDTYKIPGGASVKRGNDDLAALTLLYQRLDNFWNAQRLQVAAT
jgi:hypothetical protein